MPSSNARVPITTSLKGYRRDITCLWILGVASVILFAVIAYWQSPDHAYEYLSANRSASSAFTSEWKDALSVVEWEREYISSYLMPVVAFGVAVLTFLYGRTNASTPKSQKLWLKIAITALLSCVALMTIGLGAIRNGWVTSGDPVAPRIIWLDRVFIGPATAVLFIDAFLLFVGSIWLHDNSDIQPVVDKT